MNINMKQRWIGLIIFLILISGIAYLICKGNYMSREIDPKEAEAKQAYLASQVFAVESFKLPPATGVRFPEYTKIDDPESGARVFEQSNGSYYVRAKFTLIPQGNTARTPGESGEWYYTCILFRDSSGRWTPRTIEWPADSGRSTQLFVGPSSFGPLGQLRSPAELR